MELDLGKPITYLLSSFRYFYKGERHVERYCDYNVLLLVFDDVLRFREDGKEIEVKSGEYYLQKNFVHQDGKVPSGATKYYYIHFLGDYTDESGLLLRGKWNVNAIMPIIRKIEELKLKKNAYVEICYLFYQILLELKSYNVKTENPLAQNLMRELSANYMHKIKIKDYAKNFFVSENYLISVFKKEYGFTPHECLKKIRLNESLRLLKESNRTEKDIALSVGYEDFSVFYKAFVKQNGFSPNKVRKS